MDPAAFHPAVPGRAGDGAYLELEMQVLEGPYQGRKLWDRLNLNNANDTAVKIAKGTLSAICRAVGVLQPKDSCELRDLPMLVKVACKKQDDTDELTNVVKSYNKRQGTALDPVAVENSIYRHVARGMRISILVGKTHMPRTVYFVVHAFHGHQPPPAAWGHRYVLCSQGSAGGSPTAFCAAAATGGWIWKLLYKITLAITLIPVADRTIPDGAERQPV